MKQPLPTWLVCVFENPEFPDRLAHLRRFYQIDMVNEHGENEGSTNPDALRALGYEIPDLSHLSHGQHSFAELLQCAK